MIANFPLELLSFVAQIIPFFLQLTCFGLLPNSVFLQVYQILFDFLTSLLLVLYCFFYLVLLGQQQLFILFYDILSKGCFFFLHFSLNLFYLFDQVFADFLLCCKVLLLICLVNLLHLLFISPFVLFFILLKLFKFQLMQVLVHFFQFLLIAGFELFDFLNIGIMGIFVPHDKVLHLTPHLMLLHFESLIIAFLYPQQLLVKFGLFLFITSFVLTFDFRTFLFFFLLSILKDLLLSGSQIFLQLQLVLCFECLQSTFLSLFSLLYIFVGTLNNRKQLWFCIFNGFFLKLLYFGLFSFFELFLLKSEKNLLSLVELILILFLFGFSKLHFSLYLFAEFLVSAHLILILFEQQILLSSQILQFGIKGIFDFLKLITMITLQTLANSNILFALLIEIFSNMIFFSGYLQHFHAKFVNSHLHFVLNFSLSFQFSLQLLAFDYL